MTRKWPDANEMAEFSGQIIDIFEDFLTKRKITLKNEERDLYLKTEDDDPKNVAIIYGTVYEELETCINNSIAGTKTAIKNRQEMENVMSKILKQFENIMADGNTEACRLISTTDKNMLLEKIQETFIYWHLYMP